MSNICFNGIKHYGDKINKNLTPILNKLIKYDVSICAALISVDENVSRQTVDSFTRPTDTVVALKDGYFIVLYQYTRLQESYYAIKNLHARLLAQGYRTKIASTLLRESDKDVDKLIYRLCNLVIYLHENDMDLLSKQQAFDCTDIDFSDL